MYLPAVTFESVVSFVLGFDVACHGGLLVGLREWLIVQLDHGNNLAWIALLPRYAAKLRGDDPVATSASVDEVFQILNAFFDERMKRDGLENIYVRYRCWLEKQEWYSNAK